MSSHLSAVGFQLEAIERGGDNLRRTRFAGMHLAEARRGPDVEVGNRLLAFFHHHMTLETGFCHLESFRRFLRRGHRQPLFQVGHFAQQTTDLVTAGRGVEVIRQNPAGIGLANHQPLA